MLTSFLRLSLCSVFAFPVIAAFGGGWFQAILGIGFLIFIHEWGHYYACVLTGTRTETFSIGFGPRLFGWERDRDGKRRFTVGRRQLDPDDHAMDFRIAVVPLGGYVKMAGGEIIGESNSDDPDEFVNKSTWARAFIISAGVIMNLITAVVFYSLSFWNAKPMEPNVVGTVRMAGPAWNADIRPGDVITEIGGTEVRSFYDVRMEVALLDRDKRAGFRLERGDEKLDVGVKPHYQTEGGHLEIGLLPAIILTLGSGEDELVIGFDDAATVSGISVRGGAEALGALNQAVDAGQSPIEVIRAKGGSYTLDTTSLEPGEETGDGPGSKIGLEPFAFGEVEGVRGAAADTLALGDTLLAAQRGDGSRVPLHSANAFETLPFHAPISGIVVRRKETEQALPLTLDTPAAVAHWLSGIAATFEPTNRVVPFRAGRPLLAGSVLYRYPASPALDAGVAPGDLVSQVGETKVEDWGGLLNAIMASEPGAPLELKIENEAGGDARTVTVTPVELKRIGALPIEIETRVGIATDGFFDAFGMGLRNTGREVRNVFRTIGALFSGTINFNKNIAGPITLAKFSKAQADRGLPDLLWFLAYVSVMLAVLNILPIPVLDGGHLLFILIEKVKGSPLKESTIAKAMYVGLFLVLLLMFFAFKNDISRLF